MFAYSLNVPQVLTKFLTILKFPYLSLPLTILHESHSKKQKLMEFLVGPSNIFVFMILALSVYHSLELTITVNHGLYRKY